MACMYPATSTEPEVLYPYMTNELEKLFETETNWISNAANAAATLGFLMPQDRQPDVLSGSYQTLERSTDSSTD